MTYPPPEHGNFGPPGPPPPGYGGYGPYGPPAQPGPPGTPPSGYGGYPGYGPPGAPPPGYGYPGYGPPGTPPPGYGYLVPAPPPTGPNDPLVPSQAEGFGGWFSRVFAILGRSWKSILLISWVTFGVPVAVLAVVFGLYFDQAFIVPAPGSQRPVTFDGGKLGAFVVILLVVAIVGGYLSASAQAATVWVVTRQAAGRPTSLGPALTYGFANGIRLFGWALLYGLMIGIGLCACLIPGIYIAVAGCLYLPVALYRRGTSPISASFSLVNKNFWAALGRMLLLFVMVYGVQLVLSIPAQAARAGSQTAYLVLTVVAQLITAPLALVLTVGTVVLFAELSNRYAPTSTAQLDAAL